jgi:hypothetical protein
MFLFVMRVRPSRHQLGSEERFATVLVGTPELPGAQLAARRALRKEGWAVSGVSRAQWVPAEQSLDDEETADLVPRAVDRGVAFRIHAYH